MCKWEKIPLTRRREKRELWYVGAVEICVAQYDSRFSDTHLKRPTWFAWANEVRTAKGNIRDNLRQDSDVEKYRYEKRREGYVTSM